MTELIVALDAPDPWEMGATHVVVGRPIWKSPDPVVAARRYLDALA